MKNARLSNVASNDISIIEACAAGSGGFLFETNKTIEMR